MCREYVAKSGTRSVGSGLRDVLVPTVDSELLPLAMARTELAGHGVALVLASEQTLRDCLDKWALHSRCVGALRVPDTLVSGTL